MENIIKINGFTGEINNFNNHDDYLKHVKDFLIKNNENIELYRNKEKIDFAINILKHEIIIANEKGWYKRFIFLNEKLKNKNKELKEIENKLNSF